MTNKTVRKFGLWSSPITPGSLAEGLRLDGACWDSSGQSLVWLEGRSGTGVLVADDSPGDAPRDLTTEVNVRAEVGYGGGDFTVADGHVYFVVHNSGNVWRQSLAGGEAAPITPDFGKASSPVVAPGGRWLAYVHSDDRAVDRLAVVDTQGDTWPQILAEGHDFYMQPRISPDGRRMAWVAWDHPNMPWDGTLLYMADVVVGSGRVGLESVRTIAGGRDTSIFQPEFTPDDRGLLYVSDQTGWGQLMVYDIQSEEHRRITSGDAEYGWPAWVQDMRTYCVASDGRTVTAARNSRGFQQICRIDFYSGETTAVEELKQYSEVSGLRASPTGDRVVFVGSGPAVPTRVVEHDFAAGQTRVVARSCGETVPGESLSSPEPVSWKTTGGEEAHGLFWPPTSERFRGQGKPPLLVTVHGGPTSQATAAWHPTSQFFATRGYAVLSVNYRGSTGYGRNYMLKLRGNWGICDVEDSTSGARHLADAGRVDGDRMIIMGGSAGGFTVLQTMVTQPEAFRAGVCMYGVADQFHLADDTHKFEARYLDTLLGPLPESAEVYRERSPVFHAERICRPLAVFQGAIDKVVPQQQSDVIVEALRRRGIPHVYHVYEGEGHGWRKRETIDHFYRQVDDFLRKHVIFS